MDHEEFAARTQAVRQRLYRTAYLYLGSEADALEAVDEAVYQALRALKKLRQPELFETWLTRILINTCHKELRRRRRVTGEESLPDSAGPDAYDGLSLREAIRRLPEELRTVVILRYFAGYTLEETAQSLELPRGVSETVRFHHERLDGSGYPDGLRGSEIPLSASILSACGTYAAMLLPRPYRPARKPYRARAEMSAGVGSAWPRDVVREVVAL